MAVLKWHSPAGDELLEFDPDDQGSIKTAKKQFKKLQEQGYVAYRVVKEQVTQTVNKKGEQIRHFDPNASEILMAAPMAGG